jgi:hypothetical protein
LSIILKKYIQRLDGQQRNNFDRLDWNINASHATPSHNTPLKLKQQNTGWLDRDINRIVSLTALPNIINRPIGLIYQPVPHNAIASPQLFNSPTTITAPQHHLPLPLHQHAAWRNHPHNFYFFALKRT